MIANRMKRGLPLAAMTALVLVLIGATAADAATAPIKEVLASHIGSEVDQTTNGKICTIASGHPCQPAKPSGEPGGFQDVGTFSGANSIAVAPNKNLYVADPGNHRVQELTATGEFVLMFGQNVNKKGGNLCTAVEQSECQAGTEGRAPGRFGFPQSVAVDPTSGDVYVAELVFSGTGEFGARVQKFTAEGVFILEIGKDVNETTKGNLCTLEEIAKAGVKCKGPAERPGGSPYEWGGEAGAFNFFGASGEGGILTVGHTGILYAGDEHRVQEFDAEGKPVGEIRGSLEAVSAAPEYRVSALTVDELGDVFLVYRNASPSTVVREFDPSGKEIKTFTLSAHTREEPGVSGVELEIRQVALDPAGRLAVVETERYRVGVEERSVSRGSFYEVGAGSLRLITEFTDEFTRPFGIEASADIVFDGEALYAAGGNEVDLYVPLPVAAPVTTSPVCSLGAEHDTDVSLNCSLNGEVDPWGVKETQGWFQWGRSPALGETTPLERIPNEQPTEGVEEPPVGVSAPVEGLLPNETFYYRLAVGDHNVKPPESPLVGATVEGKTPSVPPRVVGEPSVSFVHGSSAVLFGELNPENATTRYEFQYAPAATCGSLEGGCPGSLETAGEESSAYGKIGTTLEATGLQPATAYRYRLLAVNRAGETAVNEKGASQLPEGAFTTAPGAVAQATTGAASVTGTTSATISGTVDPGGLFATYAFELGVYEGANTQYGVVFSGPAGASSVPVEETLPVTGLQPGTSYAYRIVISGGYIANPSHTVQGAPVTFTTAGLPSVLAVPVALAQLAVPPIAFPKEPANLTPKKLTRAQQLARALKACAKRPKSKRAGCRRSARKKYAASKTKAKKK
jgi:hypothetical protein